MKEIFLILLIFTAATITAQDPDMKVSEPQNAIIEFNGGKYNGYIIEFDSPVDFVEEEVKEKFKSQGVRSKKIDGFWVYRNVMLHQIDSARPMDAFIKIERKSKKESDKTVTYFIAARTGEIPDEKVKSHEIATGIGVTTVVGGAAVIHGLTPSIDQRVWDKKMLDQQAALAKEEKKMEGLKGEQTDLEKKIKQLQADLENNAKDQTAQTEEVSKTKDGVDKLLAEKPGATGKNSKDK